MIRDRIKQLYEKYGKQHIKFFASFLIILLLIMIFENNNIHLFLGIYNLILSVYSLYRFRNDKKMSMLVGIIALINISYASCVCLNAQSNAKNWQISLVNIPANFINIKNYTLFTTLFLNSLIPTTTKNDKFNFSFITGDILYYLFYVIMVLILIFGITRKDVAGYAVNQNPIFEYAIVIYLVSWIFAKDKVQRIMLLIYAILYVFRGLTIGDRSSAFPMIILNIMLLLNGKIKIKYVLILGLCGILFANVVDIYRNNNDVFTKETLNQIIDRGINVNTISYSSYAGTQIIRAKGEANHYDHMLQYTKSLFLGGTGNYVVNNAAVEKGYIQKGGGLTSTYFYYWGGYLLTVIGGLLLGFICNYFFNKKGNLYIIFQLLITIFSIRWFLYYPSAFFRTAIIVPFVFFSISVVANNMIHKKKNIFEGVIN